MDSRIFLTLIDHVYASALEPHRWSAVTDDLASILRAQNVTAILHGGSSASVLGSTASFGDEAQAAYNSHYYSIDPWAKGWHERNAGAGIFLGHELVDEKVFVRSEYYNDFSKYYDSYHFIGAVAEVTPNLALSIGFHRRREESAFGEADRRLLAVLLPHLERASWLQHKLAEVDIQRGVAYEILDRLALGAIVVDAGGQVLFANRTAEKHLRLGEALTVRHGRLRALDAKASARIDSAIRAVTARGGHGQGTPEPLHVTRANNQPPLSVVVVPLPRQREKLLLTGGAAIVFVADPRLHWTPIGKFATLYGLSPAETRLLQALVNGEQLSDYGERLRLSINTLKVQMKQIFAKTGTTRQSHLIALAIRDLVARIADQSIRRADESD